MDPSTILSANILAASTTIVIFFIFNTLQPDLVKKDGKFNTIRAFTYSISIALVFAIFVTLLSIQVDAQYATKKK